MEEEKMLMTLMLAASGQFPERKGWYKGKGIRPKHHRPRDAGPPSCPARGLVPCRPPLPGSPSLLRLYFAGVCPGGPGGAGAAPRPQRQRGGLRRSRPGVRHGALRAGRAAHARARLPVRARAGHQPLPRRVRPDARAGVREPPRADAQGGRAPRPRQLPLPRHAPARLRVRPEFDNKCVLQELSGRLYLPTSRKSAH
eukprot:6786792-Pyramimonas_sp.AAC.1